MCRRRDGARGHRRSGASLWWGSRGHRRSAASLGRNARELSVVRTLIAGGGTGGHLIPALAVADELRAADPEGAVLLVGRRGGVAEALVERTGIPLETLEIRGLDFAHPATVAGFGLRLTRSVREARRLIRRFRPDVVVGAGGGGS